MGVVLYKAVFAFDVDETLELSSGPVTLPMVAQVLHPDTIVGLCGNWGLVTLTYPHWPRLFSFIGPIGCSKETFLEQLRTYIKAEDYVMVGNDPTVFGQSQDATAAALAGWRFIREFDFAAGKR